jgi:pilus assembly protein CpaC
MGAFEVQVGRDLTKLKEMLATLMPKEQVEVREVEGVVILSGRVSSDQAKKRAESLASIFVQDDEDDKKGGAPSISLSLPGGKSQTAMIEQEAPPISPKIRNLIEVAGQRQVLLKLHFAEVNREAMKKFGLSLGFADLNGNFIFTFLGGLLTPVPPQEPANLFDLRVSQNATGAGALKTGSGRILGFLDALKGDGLVKILAEPNLVCVSGKKANFLAGGEFPIPVPQKDTITIKFKKYGVELEFLPVILSDGRIRLTVAPEVSELDFSNTVVISGYVVPGITTRRARTQLELADGQEFALAGLLKQEVASDSEKVPILGEIPILGALFRSSAYRKRETELIIVVTPIILKGQKTPKSVLTERDFVPPSDLEFFLYGRITPRQETLPEEPAREQINEMEGKFGHEVLY